MTAFVSIGDVRDYLNVTGTTGTYSDGLIGSNVRVASSFLQRTTGRQFEPQTGVTKTFTTEGRAMMVIPDLRTASSVTLQTGALTADASYWLIPDQLQDGVYTAIQFRQFSRIDYRANPEWFDRNLDSWMWQARENNYGSIPNDLAIAGDWGWLAYPDELLHATKVLAAWYTVRPDAVLSNVIQSAGGAVSDVSQMPPEVQQFVGTWTLRESVVVI